MKNPSLVTWIFCICAKKAIFHSFLYDFESSHNCKILVIFRLRRSDIFCCAKCDIETNGFSDIIFALNARSAYHLRSKYHAPQVHITRRKANITENTIALAIVFFLAESKGFEPLVWDKPDN